MTGTTRIPAVEITGLKGALIKRFARKALGQVPSSLGVYWHNQKVLTSMAGIGGKLKKWDACDEQLKSFAHMAVAAQVGCTLVPGLQLLRGQQPESRPGQGARDPAVARLGCLLAARA